MSTPHDSRPRTVIILQHTGIGDLVWHVTYFQRLAENSQGDRVTLVAQPSTLARAFLGDLPWIEEIIDHDHRPRRSEKRRGHHAGLIGMWRMAQELRRRRFDRIVLFSGRSSRGLIAWLSGIPIRQGFGYRRLQRLFLSQGPWITAYTGPSLAVYPESSAFMVALGLCPAPLRPVLTPQPAQLEQMRQKLSHLPRPWVALAIGTSETHKQWGIERYAELAQALLEQGTSVILLGGPAEAQLARDIEHLIGMAQRNHLALVTDAPVQGSMAVLALCDACAGNDTGMINVAAAVSCPSLVLIGPRARLDQDPEHLQNITAPHLADITADQVLARLNALLRAKTGSAQQDAP